MFDALKRVRPQVACAIVALVMGLLAALPMLSVKDYRPSALVRMTPFDPIAGRALEGDEEFALWETEHYDGIYFYAIARDPFALAIEHRLIDLPGARYGHPLYGWLALILSLGAPLFIPGALMATNLAGMAVGGYATSILSRQLGWTPWAGLFFALNPGFLFAMEVSTSEIFGACLFVLALLAWFRERWILAAVLMAALCLTKEQFVFVPIGLGLWEIVERWPDWRSSELGRRLGLLAIGPVVLFVWEIYLLFIFGRWAFSDYGNLGSPFYGIGDALAAGAFEAEIGRDYVVQMALASGPLILTMIGASVVGLVVGLWSRTQVAFIFIGLSILNFSLTWHNLYFIKDLLRQFSLPMLLLPLVLGTASLVTKETKELRRHPGSPAKNP